MFKSEEGFPMMFSEDGMVSEKIKRIRRERGGILSVLTRQSNEIRELMLQCVPISEVEEKMTSLKQTFNKFTEKQEQHKSLVNGDWKELKKSAEYFEEVKERYDMLKTDVAMWEERDIRPSASQGDVVVKFEDSFSQVCNSKVSSATSSRAKAAAKKAALMIRADGLKKRQEIKRKQIELEQMDETMALETEIAAVEAEEQVLAEYSSSVGGKAKSRLSDSKGNTDNRPKEIDVKSPENRESERDVLETEVKGQSGADQVEVNNITVISQADNDRTIPNSLQSQCGDNMTQQQEIPTSVQSVSNTNERSGNGIIDNQMIAMQQQMLNVMQLPKTELMTFDGDPLKYWLFIRAFENSLEGTGVSDSVKLNRLLQYCTHKALEVIECCSVMEPGTGYTEARRLLLSRFGNQFVISKAWVSKVTDGPYLKYGDNAALQRYADNVRSCVVTLTAMGRLSEVDNQMRMSKMIEKLPPFLQGRWRTEAVRCLKRNGYYPDINHLVEFIDMAAEEANDPVFGTNIKRDFKDKSQKSNYKSNSTGASFIIQTNKNVESSADNQHQSQATKFPPCRFCSGDHAIYVCLKFKQLAVGKRFDFVKSSKLCFNCFSPKHMSYACSKPSMCNINGCDKKHSRLLHIAERNDNETSTKYVDTDRGNQSSNPVLVSPNPAASNSMCGITGAGIPRTALPIVPVLVRTKDQGSYIITNALLDSGSTHTFCSQALADQLDLQGTKTTLSLTTLSKENCKSETMLVSLDVGDVKGRQLMTLSHVFVIPKLPVLRDSIVSQEDVNMWPHLQGICLPSTDQADVTLLIGQDNPMALAPLEVRRGDAKQPYATRTAFGWTLNGPLNRGFQENTITNFVKVDQDLQMQVEKFWKLDVSETDVSEMSADDRRVVDIWNDTIQMTDGHYEMSIPFKTRPPLLPNNYCVAESRLENLKRKLSKDKSLYEKYKKGIQELFDKGYAEKVPDDDINDQKNPIWYLPHHAVTSDSKPDKLRIVFDCSAKYSGTSLNETVLQGPDLTNKLLGVLLRFRQEQVALMGDIEGMFHQVKVTPEDRDVLRFLWWPNGNMCTEPEIYRMSVHLFGGVWSPSCASFALRPTAEDNTQDFHETTVQTVLDNFYVDDCLESVPSEKEAIHRIQELNKLLERGGFKLTKWISNRRAVVESVPIERRAKAVLGIDLNSNSLPLERALGVHWDTESDTLGFKIHVKEKPCTRRGVMSVISSVYDPFGFVCPLILQAKIIFQDECRLKKGWDEPLESYNTEKWFAWKQGLSEIEHFSESRCYVPKDFGAVRECQVHLFSDASLVGYGAVAYMRLVDFKNRIHVVFLMGKSRLAPIKQLTIPRLELSAAVTAVKLSQMLQRELRMKIDRSVFWTDSMVVLAYITNQSKRFQTFVANRVATIQAGSSPKDWRHVESKLNPADDASRGLKSDELIASSRWREGPNYLWLEESSWPTMPGISDVPETDAEVKKVSQVNLTLADTPACTRLLKRFSSWSKLKSCVAWILRLKTCLRNKARGQDSTVEKTPLTIQEIRQAELEIVRLVQRTHFSDEIDDLTKDGHRSVSQKSPIYRLEPMINADGVLCVRGRLTAAPINSGAQHQIILPKENPIVPLIVRHYHELLGHSGREHVLSYIRQKFWIVRARTAIKKVLRHCVHCKRRQGPHGAQKMADLPVDRVTPGKPPFTYTGVDCFGPFVVKRGRVQVKRYGCLFTCLTTRAIHIEKLDTMNTDSFINALRRFESRRGRPEKIRSDNGSNFRSGERELNESIKAWNQKGLNTYMIQKEIEWQFNPPTASHMGGIWERQIRTVRKVMNSLINEQCLDDEGLNTLFCEIESIVNSRPITVLSDNPSDAEPLTPNHLLLLRAGPQTPPGLFRKEDVHCKRWRQVQFLADCFWKRWVREYLPTLQLRQKWLRPRRNFQEGDVVLIMDENTHRRDWPLGRIQKTFPGTDGLVRSVELISRGSLFRRPVHKLCLIESAVE